jgi:S-formylglutathione hydrolase FrmB
VAASRLTSCWRKHSLDSKALRGNPLGDPHERDLWVWSPADDSRRYPTVYVLHAHMRTAGSWFNVEPFEQSYPHQIDTLAPDAVVVLVDGWTSVGGSQWLDSTGIGAYSTYLCDEVVAFVDGHYPTGGARGLQGKSSGGYGAVVNALARPDLFSAFAAHAPDALFDVTIAHSVPAAARELRDRFAGSLEAFWATFDGLHSRGDALLVELGSAALAYGDGTLPFDLETAELDPEAWSRWLLHDPVRLVAAQPAAAAGLHGVWLDAGRSDEYFLDLGALALRRALLGAGVPQERLRFELFDGGHRGVSGRYPLSLAFLVESLSMTF